MIHTAEGIVAPYSHLVHLFRHERPTQGTGELRRGGNGNILAHLGGEGRGEGVVLGGGSGEYHGAFHGPMFRRLAQVVTGRRIRQAGYLRGERQPLGGGRGQGRLGKESAGIPEVYGILGLEGSLGKLALDFDSQQTGQVLEEGAGTGGANGIHIVVVEGTIPKLQKLRVLPTDLDDRQCPLGAVEMLDPLGLTRDLVDGVLGIQNLLRQEAAGTGSTGDYARIFQQISVFSANPLHQFQYLQGGTTRGREVYSADRLSPSIQKDAFGRYRAAVDAQKHHRGIQVVFHL